MVHNDNDNNDDNIENDNDINNDNVDDENKDNDNGNNSMRVCLLITFYWYVSTSINYVPLKCEDV